MRKAIRVVGLLAWIASIGWAVAVIGTDLEAQEYERIGRSFTDQLEKHERKCLMDTGGEVAQLLIDFEAAQTYAHCTDPLSFEQQGL